MDKVKEPEGEAVTIAVRQRPLTDEEKENNEEKTGIKHLEDNVLLLKNNDFTFDKIIQEDQSQQEIYEILIKPLVNKVLAGFDCVVLAYGQTGTGKTYTMGLESEEVDVEKTGMIPRALDDIFKISNSEETTVSVSFIEIYNEKVYDILSDNPTLQIYNKGQRYTGATKKVIVNNDANSVLKQGNKNRHVRPTKMNPSSSRSHAIFSIHIESVHDTVRTESALHLVDLAGSEGVRRTSHRGDALAEGVHINQGLLCIANVIGALSQNAKVTPYRDSVLTSVLQDSLNSKSYLTLLACISPLQKDVSETMSTLRFAKRAKSLKNTPEINAKIAEHKKPKTPLFKTPFPMQRPSASKLLPNWVTSTAFTSGGARRALILKPKVLTPINRLESAQANKMITPHNKQNTVAKGQQLFSNDTVDFSVISKPTENQNESMGCSMLEDRKETSTSVDATAVSAVHKTIESIRQSTMPTMSYSPIVRQYMEEIKGTVDRRLTTFLNDLEKTNRIASKRLETCYNLEFDATIQNNEETALAASRTFKRPVTPFAPKRRSIETLDQIEVLRSDNSDNEGDAGPLSIDLANGGDETIKRTLRRNTSVGIASFYSVDNHSIMNSTMKEDVPDRTVLRRSTRLSMRANSTLSSQPNSTGLSVDNHSAVSRSSSVRRSARLSIMSDRRNNEKTKVADQPRSLNDITNHIHMARKMCDNDVPKPRKSHKKLTVEKNIEKVERAGSKAEAINAHKKYVMKILNTGDLKEVQQLSSIGIKTAHQIILYRSINGKFRDIESMEKLPFWRGKGYTRFVEANNLQ